MADAVNEKQTFQSLLKKIRQIEIKSKKLSTDTFSGNYSSAFKGRGMSFKEVREYAAGDDVRFIDWNTSARFGHPFSKLFEEDRENTLMLLIDCSASNLIGTSHQTKQELITEISALVAFSAIKNNDKVGAIFFTDKIEKFIPPKKGKGHVLHIIAQMLTINPASKHTDIAAALQFLNQVVRNKAIVVLCSDFEDNDAYFKTLKAASYRHDCVGIQVYDAIEAELPKAGLIPFVDAESGELIWVDSANKDVQQNWKSSWQRDSLRISDTLKAARWDFIKFCTGDDYIKNLQSFFVNRIKRR